MYRSTGILSITDWLERLETLLSHLTATWDGLLILTGGVNINMLQPANSLTKQYLYCLVYHRNRYWDLLFSTYMFLIFKSTSSVFAISR